MHDYINACVVAFISDFCHVPGKLAQEYVSLYLVVNLTSGEVRAVGVLTRLVGPACWFGRQVEDIVSYPRVTQPKLCRGPQCITRREVLLALHEVYILHWCATEEQQGRLFCCISLTGVVSDAARGYHGQGMCCGAGTNLVPA